ncbi:MAG: S8 family serine peptidase [Acidobacteriota bacterium]|nr:S8 family serine peptidase [Acidobacteriota bacterium]
MQRNSILLFLVLAAGISLRAQVVPGRYIVELQGRPARVGGMTRQQGTAREAIEREGGVVWGSTRAVANALLVRIAPENAARLRNMPGVRHVHEVRMYHRSLDHALPLVHVPEAWNLIGGQDQAGLGVKIAIIDTGIDSSHPAFQDASLPMPDGFPRINKDSDLMYTNGRIIVARAYTETAVEDGPPALDVEGHGTGVAMTAAGGSATGPYGPITGVAPKAYLGNYKVFPDPNSGAPIDLILLAIDDAVADGMDVLNLSLGGIPATRRGDDPLVEAVENAVALGAIVTIAAGNEGSDLNTIASPGTSPSAITVGSALNDRIFGGSEKLGDGPPVLAIPGNGRNSSSPISAPLADVAPLDSNGMACGPLPDGSLPGSIALVLRGVCPFEDKINNVARAGAVAALIYTDAARPDAIVMAVGGATLPAAMVSYPNGIAAKQQIAGGTVSATLDFSLQAIASPANQISGFSSRGPNTDGGIKPDLLAIGDTIYTATNGSGFVVESGTSFSSPMTAGAAALVKAARPGLTAQQYRSLLIDTGVPVIVDSGQQLPLQRAGGGILNVFAALTATSTAVPASLSFGIGSDTADQTRTLTVSNVSTNADTFSIVAQPVNGPAPALAMNTVQLLPGQSQDVAVQYTNSGLAPGSYWGFLQIQGSQNQTVTAVPYWYGVGSQTAQYVSVFNPPTSARRGSRQSIVLRITDAEGIALAAAPNVTITDGGGSVISLFSVDADIPGALELVVRLGPAAGNNVFHIDAGAVSKDLTITGQ